LIYFCVPTHNEEKTVGVVLWKLRHVMAELPRDYQILVGDDASSDGSAQVLDPYRRVLPVVLMRNEKRLGYAATLEMLLRQAVRMSRYPKRDSVVILQADFTDDLDTAADLLRRLESGADIATGGPVADTVRPGFLERVALGYSRRVLSRFEWPENADPLNTLCAYRLMCVKRALEESQPGRLLAWDGRTANAALLRATLPHARRIECVEMSRHGERAQRGRRFRPFELVSNVRRFAAGQTANGVAAVDALEPDEVKGDLSVLHGPAANGAGETASRSERAAPARSRGRGAGNAGDPQKRPRRPPKTADAGGPSRPPRRRKPGPADAPPAAAPNSTGADGQSGADTAAPAAAGATADGDRPKRRSRGGRRGGRNRKRPSPSPEGMSATEDKSVAEPATAGGAVAGSPGPAAGPDQNDQVVAGQEDTTGEKKRRRRGRRGGKGRRGGRPNAGTNDAPGTVEEPQTPGSAEGSST
jgi:hypothetical protein